MSNAGLEQLMSERVNPVSGHVDGPLLHRRSFTLERVHGVADDYDFAPRLSPLRLLQRFFRELSSSGLGRLLC
ncbi:uncharacterized protein PHALS_15380 [Plasmopara halstedii]|uniref:Uncharacterized protein n=1 Tax=Plasmopara halstedii TaxID=4781 RepID=A0A0P1AE79_PLAHL|nr:uncharacterized protein PHALS_15380 [Plasmopara halstedii]CEG39352.1 hypothetical protein PHALS_15380 [Plasmopara halstedii]|eukprot:XP_024575721.1 hypothetical protein PHALS_15380 [Plasmopara halstedii]